MSSSFKSVLLVGQDPDFQFALRRLFEMNGTQVSETANFHTARTLAEAQVPNLIILDLDHRTTEALSFLESRKTNSVLEKIPFMVATTRRDATFIRSVANHPIQELLMKPIDARDLYQRAQKILKRATDLVFHFDSASRPKVRARVQASIVLGNEVGFLLEAPMKLADESRIEIQSPILSQLGVSTSLFQRTSRPPKMGSKGQFLNEIAVIGLGKVAVDRIRKILGEWK